jgi:hypothetical protein
VNEPSIEEHEPLVPLTAETLNPDGNVTHIEPFAGISDAVVKLTVTIDVAPAFKSAGVTLVDVSEPANARKTKLPLTRIRAKMKVSNLQEFDIPYRPFLIFMMLPPFFYLK